MVFGKAKDRSHLDLRHNRSRSRKKLRNPHKSQKSRQVLISTEKYWFCIWPSGLNQDILIVETSFLKVSRWRQIETPRLSYNWTNQILKSLLVPREILSIYSLKDIWKNINEILFTKKTEVQGKHEVGRNVSIRNEKFNAKFWFVWI